MRVPSLEETGHLLRELKRRHVFRVAVAYGVAAWAIIQVTDTISPVLTLPQWTTPLIVVLALAGFPLAVILAWAFEITPEGVRRTDPLPEEAPPAAPPASRAVRVRGLFPAGAALLPERSVEPRTEAPGPPAPPDPARARRASLATLRHELRTPLVAVLGYSEMLLEDAREAHEAELTRILASGQSLLSQIDQLLRPGAGLDELTDDELERIGARIRTDMSPPARALLEQCERLVEGIRTAGETQLAPDVDKVTSAAARLLDLAETACLEAETASRPSARAREVAERVIGDGARRAAEEAPPRHGHLLVVDDNALNRDLLSRQLARHGYSVSVASDGREALDALRSHDFDMVLLDVLMPGIDGIQVLEQMRRDRAMAEIPVIMTSALNEIDSVVRCIERGAVDYLIKPFDPVLLQARIEATLELHRLRAWQRHAAAELRAEAGRSGRLARSLVPVSLVERVREGGGSLVEVHSGLSVLALTFQGLSTYATRNGAGALGSWMGEVVEAVERVLDARRVEAHWEGGATLFASAGPSDSGSDPAAEIAELAMLLRDEVAGRATGTGSIRVGIGLHLGPAVSALASGDRVLFGLWGEAPDVARELARQAPPGDVHVSAAAYAALYERYALEGGGLIETTSRSQMRAYRLVGRKRASPSPA